MTLKILQRKINTKLCDELITSGFSPAIAKIIAARPYPVEHKDGVLAAVDAKLKYLDSPFLLKDMQKAAERIVVALQNNECIGIETDHDCDGQTSHAVLYSALIDIFKHPKAKVKSYIGHRLKEGYGLSMPVAERILADSPQPSLVITADNGSADEARIALLKQANIDVIVTDHHELPQEGAPKSAYACLNPTQDDCNFPDPLIAGCMVAWLLMAAVRKLLIDSGKLANDKVTSLACLLDFVAVGTVADCVSMARSVNNRAVVRFGLRLISAGIRPCWQAIKPLLNRQELLAEDLGFAIGPLLNSDGRLADAFGSVNFVLSKDLSEATPWAQSLWQQNQERKAIQKEITQAAMQAAKDQVAKGRYSLVINLVNGHAGVHGISASRVKDHFGRPVIIFSPKQGEPDVITGSARSIDSLHMKEALQNVANKHHGLVMKFGGHKGAAGVAIAKSNFNKFSLAFEDEVKEQLNATDVGPVIFTDGKLNADNFALDFVDQLSKLDPYGREFEKPCFELEAWVKSIRFVGQDKTHAQVKLQLDNGQEIGCIWFSAREHADAELHIKESDKISSVFSFGDNSFRGRRSLQLQILHAEKL